MLLLFAFSITPKRWLHDVFASHKDRMAYSLNQEHPSVTAEHINCHCDNIVADSPFTLANPAFAILALSQYPVYTVAPATDAAAPEFATFLLRGPPSVC